MALQHSLRKNLHILLSQKRSITVSQCCTKSDYSKYKKVIPAKSLDAVGASIACKGFLRPHKSYEPPANVTEKVYELCAKLQIPGKNQQQLNNLEQKFKLLEACFKDFHHSVPSSQVHALQTVGEVIGFYETAVDTTVPYEALKKMDLPENLHIQYEYLRFHPDTDTKFGGQTAFPKSSTLVTGLKYRGKYAGHIAKQSWP